MARNREKNAKSGPKIEEKKMTKNSIKVRNKMHH